VILDDIGYVQQSRDEMEVLFTFLAERYERKSVLITSNLVFSDWIRIFKDPMTTAAADRIEPIREAGCARRPSHADGRAEETSWTLGASSSATEAGARTAPSTRAARPPTGHTCAGRRR